MYWPVETVKENRSTMAFPQVKLFWKEVREDMIPVTVGKTIWDELPSANVDTQKLEHLFESRAKDLMTKVGQFPLRIFSLQYRVMAMAI